MKKIFVWLLIFIFSCSISFAKDTVYNLTMKDKLLITNISTKINKLTEKKWDIIVSRYVAKINLAIKKSKKDSRTYLILTWIKTKIVDYQNTKYKKENKIEEKKVEVKKETNKSTYESKNSFSDLKIDMSRVRTAWLWYYNEVRKNIWKSEYSFDEKLNDTAEEWSDTSLSRWVMSHKRDSGDSYYNYNKITSRFKDRWVVCKNVNRITHSENIGRWYYSCSDSNDCTDKLIWGIKQVFDMYMAEKWKSNHVHYDSVVMTQFSKIWVWIAIKKSGGSNYEFYITTHYCTELE